MSEPKKKLQHRERLIWIGLALMLSVVSFTLMLPARAFAETPNSQSQRLLNMFEQVYQFVQDNYVDQVDPQVLIEGALKGMFDSLGDPHSAYLDSEEMRALTDTTQGRFGGVGMYIAKQTLGEDASADAPRYVEVVSPIEDTPAFKAGIQAGDLIVSVEGKTTSDLSIDEVVDSLRGAPGSDVTITIRRGQTHTFPVTLTRDTIEVPTVKWDMIPGNIGFLRIIQFTPYTDDRVREAIDFFKKHNYTSMIIDLRHNPGGLLTGVVDTADLFFNDGLIVGTHGRNPEENAVYNATPGAIVPQDIPIVVLIDGGSASAAEILAGALKDRDRGYLVGEKTYGKGSVQQVRSIGTGGFRLTMARYYTPNGTYIDKIGITPDKVVKTPELTDAQLESYAKLRSENTITDFATQHKNASDARIDQFITELQKQGIKLDDHQLAKMIHDEIRRVNNETIVYDLTYDTVLQDAVKMLRNGEVPVH